MDYFGKYKIIPKCTSTSDEYFLSQEDINFFNENGYIVMKKLFNVEELERFKARFIELCDGVDRGHVSIVKDKHLEKTKKHRVDYVNKIQELLYDKVYMAYSENPRLLHIVSQFIGDDITATNCMLINKPPGVSRHPPHQDLYYFPFRPAEKIIAVWTAVDPVNYDNGCLYMIPGSHKAKTLYVHGDHKEDMEQMFHGVVDEELLVPEDKKVYLTMDPGDTVFFSTYIVHGSGSNTSTQYRKAMTCHYASSHCHHIDVSGTTQQLLARQAEDQMREMGGDLSFNDIWRVKCKLVKGVRSNL